MYMLCRGTCAIALTLLMIAIIGCESPFDFSREDDLRNSLIAEYSRELKADDAGPEKTVTRPPSEVELDLTPERRAELDKMSGYEAYAKDPLDAGPGLTDDPEQPYVVISLPEAIQQSVENNLDIQQARLVPNVSEQQLIQAQAAFDFVYFADVGWTVTDQPGPPLDIPGVSPESGDSYNDTIAFGTGLRKVSPLTGGQFNVQTDVSRVRESGGLSGDQRYYLSDIQVSMTQPLLQGFGPDIAQSQVVLARIARDQDVANLKTQIMDLVVNTEAAYWNLVDAVDALKIQTRLLERTIEDRDKLSKRAKFDVTPVQLTEANSFVEIRRSTVIQTRNRVRQASDTLKQLINDPTVPLSEEALMIPADRPIEDPISFSLLDSVTTALRERPEMQVALLGIEDASVQQRVADNARLPTLDLTASVGLNGFSENDASASYSNLFDAGYVDYAVGGQFEQPILNREADAGYEAAKLNRDSAVLAYQGQAQQVVLDVKTALRNVMTSYELIGANRAARRAAADNLRAIEEQEKAGVALTPEFINLKLQAQERLAETEIAEVQATTDYNNAITSMYRSMGTLLEREGIGFDNEPYSTENEFMLWP